MVVAIGNPLGVELMGTLTMGVVSATNREIDLEDGRTMDTIQTDAAINSGNSGGGRFNANGELIGITTMKISASSSTSSASVEGLGFAIPINEALTIIDSLKQTGKVERPTLGITAANFTKEYADMYSLEAGIYISEVTEGSAAKKPACSAWILLPTLTARALPPKRNCKICSTNPPLVKR
jgi:serine protease Do